jgi:aspartate 1-decarboxylase
MKSNSVITHSDIIARAKVVFGGSIGLDTTALDDNCLEESWSNYDNVYVNHVSDINNAAWVNKVLKEGRPTIMLCKFNTNATWFDKACEMSRLGIVIKAYVTDDNQEVYNHHLAVFLFNTNKHSRTFIGVFSDIGYFLY